MSIFIGSNAGETIEPGFVSPTVAVLGHVKSPSAASDLIIAGGGNDIVAGGGGNDIAFLGAGDDLFIWNSGDGSDFVDGGSGTDTLAFNGSAAAETIRISTGPLGTLRVSDNVERATETLVNMEHIVISAGAGDDIVDASALPAGHVTLEIFGGLGNDTLIGSSGNDFFNGGDGNDTALMGAGDDTFVWNPGDDNDIVDGQAGTDTLIFNGANIAEQINIQANGSRVLFTRDIANVTMDLNSVEHIQFNALGGADIITVHDLSGTGVTEVDVNLAATQGGTTGDGAADKVVVQGTSGNDVIHAETNGTTGTVTGLAAVSNVNNLEAIDQLVVDGGAGNDTIIGGAGSQVLHGGDGDDVLQGGAGDDQMFGDAGNDRMIWNPGDGTDLMEGGDGTDTAEVNGGNGAEQFTVTANGTRVRFDRVSPAPFSLDIGTTEKLVVNMGGGDDMFSATGNLAALISVTVDGGAGNDTILGGNGNDLLFGGDGNDFIDGNQGADSAFLGTGDDTFQWDPGDGSDLVDGQAGTDTLLFNGANIAEQMDVLPNGSRALFTRNIGNITMDLNGIERINVNALGGADLITVHDMTGTDVKEINVNLAGTLGGATGDGAADQVVVQGTSGNDVIHAETNGTTGTVTGLAAVTSVTNLETIDQLVVDGGAGNDTLIGGAGSQVLHGGEGDDVLQGGAGDDQMFGDAGNDRMVWNPGDGTDLMEGGDGIDTAEVNGGNGAEQFTATANGTRVRFDRISPAPFSLDIGTTEKLVVNMNGGDDTFSASGNLSPLISLVVDGGAGNDTILGGNGNDLLFGGDGNDFIDGNQGADSAFLGSGDDTFQWDPGDGSDLVEGQDGFDTLLFNGANIAEQMDVLANGTRALFTRNVGNITMDLAGIERINVNALGGADIITVHDMTGTGVTEVNVNLAATGGGGDGAADQVIAQGTSGDDIIHAEVNGTSGSVTGLAAVTNVTNLETIDQLIVDGGAGNDTLLGGAGTQVLHGGEGDDVLAGGSGDDQMFGDAGNDRMVWNPGDGTDLMEGGDGVDTAEVNGGNGAEQFTVTANGTRVRFDRISPAPFSIDIGTTEKLVVNMGGGDDMFSATGNLAALIGVTVDGGAGNDTILGGNGNDLLFGGDGNDFIDGNQGADTAFLGTGDDTFQWDPGDGSDVVDGQDGFDTLLFNGANIAEQMDVLANGTRSLFTRNIGNITMDLNSIERINVNALGGADLITVHDMAGTGVSEVNVNLAGTLGGVTGDGAADQVIVQGTSGDDVIHIETNGSSATVTGLAAVTNVTNLETIDQLVIDGGAGNDTIFGSAGNDFVVGGKGADSAFLGAGDDTFVWNPGDGSDLVEGQDGFDTLAFNGANVAEKVDVLANGSRTQFTRDIASINMDVNGVERIDFNALGAADNVTVHDLSGTGVTQVNVKLAGTLGGSAGDGAADQVTVEATSGDDVAVISGDANGVSVAGLAAQVNLTGVDGTLDHLQVNGGDGDDLLDASHLAAGAIGLVLDGGAGNDMILGSAGDDVLRGGPGDDVINGGGGHDIIDAGPGDNVVIQGFTSGEDRIDLRGIADAHDFAWVLAHARDVDGSAVIDVGEGGEMKVADVSVASLHASDFLLA